MPLDYLKWHFQKETQIDFQIQFAYFTACIFKKKKKEDNTKLSIFGWGERKQEERHYPLKAISMR